MEIQKISSQPQFTAVKSSGLTQKQRVIFNKLESLFDICTTYKDCDLFISRSEIPYIHHKSGRYEHCAEMAVLKNGEKIRINSEIPNTTRAWMKSFREILKIDKNGAGWKYLTREMKAGEKLTQG